MIGEAVKETETGDNFFVASDQWARNEKELLRLRIFLYFFLQIGKNLSHVSKNISKLKKGATIWGIKLNIWDF